MGGWQGLEVGKTVVLIFEKKGVGMHQARPHKSLNWLKCREIHSRHLYSIPQSYAAIPRLAKPSLGHQTRLPPCFRKQPAKTDHSSVACFELVYSCTILFMMKD